MRDKQYISARINEEIDKAQVERTNAEDDRSWSVVQYYDGLIDGLRLALRIVNEKPVISQDAVLTDESVEERE